MLGGTYLGEAYLGESSPSVATDPYSAVVLADAPSGFWRLNELSGSTFVDSSGNSRNMTITGTPTFNVAGPPGVGATGVTFSGSEYASITTPTWFTAGSSWTLECWIKTSSSGLNAGVITRDDANFSAPNAARMIELEVSSGKAATEVFNSSGTNFVLASSTLTDGKWHHIVMTYGSNTATLYQDGVSLGTASLTGPLTAGTGVNLLLGATTSNGTPFRKFTGSLASAAIYPTALSSTRVAAHYYTGSDASRSITSTTSASGSISISSYTALVLSDSPLAAWRQDNTTGGFDDYTGNGHGLTNSTSVTYGTGPRFATTSATIYAGNCGATPASSSWLSAPTTFSAECWFKATTSASSGTVLISRDDGDAATSNAARMFQVSITTAGKLKFETYNTSGNIATALSTPTYLDGQWHHVVATYSSGAMVLYVDSVSVATATQTGTLNSGGSTPFCLASCFRNTTGTVGSSAVSHTGSMYMSAIYPTALSAARVQAHYLYVADAALAVTAGTTASGMLLGVYNGSASRSTTVGSTASGQITRIGWGILL